MKGSGMARGLLYLVMVAAMGVAVFCLLAGICCLRLEEYRQQDSNREPALESQAQRKAEEILNIYLSQGMEQADAYAEEENVNYVIQKVSGRRLGGNYRAENTWQVLKLGGKTLQYIYSFPGTPRGSMPAILSKSLIWSWNKYWKSPFIWKDCRMICGCGRRVSLWRRELLAAVAVILWQLILIGRRVQDQDQQENFGEEMRKSCQRNCCSGGEPGDWCGCGDAVCPMSGIFQLAGKMAQNP